jgi:PilZ domain-containing protein
LNDSFETAQATGGEMEQMSGDVLQSRVARRWPRYQIELPVRIIALNGVLTTPVTARGTAISRAGMALHAGVALNPGDLMQIQFPTPDPSRVNAVVRNRSGNRLGLEFLSQLPPDAEAAADRSGSAPSSVVMGPSKLRKSVPAPQTLYASLRRKQEELKQLQKEIEVLSVAILLLAENEEDEKDICKLPIPRRLEPAVRPWPPQS